MSNVLAELEWRGLLHQTAGADIDKFLATPGRVAYAGFDPSRDSLTIGNYIPIKMLMHWQRAGHKPVALMGGGTGLIGDPSGKDAERQLLTADQVVAHVESCARAFQHLLDFSDETPQPAIVVNNLDWLQDLGYIDVLRDVGKHFSVNVMIQKDSVRDRLQNRDQGISYTEFSYMILQAYDFLHLRRTMDCRVQMSGSDQYGNIVAGMDLIRREFGDQGDSYAITAPLVMGSDGKKIGKTEKGAVWLNADRTSPYAFYQYWVNIADDDVISFLKKFTLLERQQIEAIEKEHLEAPHRRAGQTALAEEMTRLIHGEEELARCKGATAALFGSGDVRELDPQTLRDMFADVPHSQHPKSQLSGDGIDLVEVLAESSLAKSKREAREFIGNGAVAVNGQRVDRNEERRLSLDDLLHGTTILLKRGKKLWHATRWVD